MIWRLAYGVLVATTMLFIVAGSSRADEDNDVLAAAVLTERIVVAAAAASDGLRRVLDTTAQSEDEPRVLQQIELVRADLNVLDDHIAELRSIAGRFRSDASNGRDSRKIVRQDALIALRLTAERLEHEQERIDALKDEAAERFEAAMDAATGEMILGIITGVASAGAASVFPDDSATAAVTPTATRSARVSPIRTPVPQRGLTVAP